MTWDEREHEPTEDEKLAMTALKEANEIFRKAGIPHLIIAGVPNSAATVSAYEVGRSKGAAEMIKKSFEVLMSKVDTGLQRPHNAEPELEDDFDEPPTKDQVVIMLEALLRTLTISTKGSEDDIQKLVTFAGRVALNLPKAEGIPAHIMTNVLMIKESIDLAVSSPEQANIKYLKGIVALIKKTVKSLKDVLKNDKPKKQ